jgi:hypothetical protein
VSLAFRRRIRRVPRHQDLVLADMHKDLASEEIGRPALALRHDPVLSGLEPVQAGGYEGLLGAELLEGVDVVEAESGGELEGTPVGRLGHNHDWLVREFVGRRRGHRAPIAGSAGSAFAGLDRGGHRGRAGCAERAVGSVNG